MGKLRTRNIKSRLISYHSRLKARMRPDLFNAAKKGDLKTLQILHRQKPIRRWEVTFEGNTALHIAAREGHVEVVQWILNNVRGCCIAGARNYDKNTSLHEAAKKGNPEVLGILLQHKKCAVWRRNQYGETALIIASDHGHVAAARLLLVATPLFLVLWPRDDRQTCLCVAAYAGHLDVVKMILNEKSSCFNAIHGILLIKDENGVTPLHAAVHGGHVSIVREILNIQLNWCYCSARRLMTKTDNLGRCAIHIAAMKGSIDIIDEFMKVMPDCVEIRSTELKTVVHFAVEYNQSEIVKRLTCENEDERNAKLLSYDYDIHGNTALHLAAKNGVNPEIVEYIVSISNAYLNAKNNEGKSPLDIAVVEQSQNKLDYGEIVSILENAGATQSLIFESKSKLPLWQYYDKIRNQSNDGVEGKIFDVDTLVASLIATITFQALFQVPGGTNEEPLGTKQEHFKTNQEIFDPNDQLGLARMSLATIFKVFLFSDCVAFFASMTVVIAWIFRERLQTRLIADRSPVALLSMLSLGTSIVSTCLAFLSATILVTIPRDFEKTKEHQAYRLIFIGEILTAYVAPALAVVFLSLAWIIEYNFNATNEQQARLKRQLKQVLIFTLPVVAIVLSITFAYFIKIL